MPAKDESKESAKYLLYVKLLHDGALSAEDKGAYENMQTVYGYSASETPSIEDWWDTLRLELDCASMEEFEMGGRTPRMTGWSPMDWPQGAFASWQNAADSEEDITTAWFARVMLRLHRADTSGLVEDAESAWDGLQTILQHIVHDKGKTGAV